MKFWQRISAVVLLALPLGAQATGHPQQIVETATNALLERVLKEKAVLQKDPQALYRLVDENITPFVDVDGIARSVMGQYFRQATPAQQKEFARVFKQSLVRTYAKGLTSYENQKIVFKPYKAGADAGKAQVDIDVHGNGGQIYPVTFQLQTDKAGEWKVRNIFINGINLGLTFRNQFSSAVEANRGSIDAAIAGWAPDTRALDDAPAKADKK
ncbi:MAG: ABC transporter substrate-binding protein [Moraxellaceae bacterium]|nr:ABC transporter substrate-binding protein [Moraxellaceae bacterium]